MDRKTAFAMAKVLLEDVLDKYELETISYGGSLMAPAHKMTAAEQHIDHILRVANWLLEGDDNMFIDTEDTLFKVREALENINLSETVTTDAISEMLNAGIVFRERP